MGQTTNGRLGDDLDVVAGDLLVPLSAALADILSSAQKKFVTIETKNAVETRFGGNWVVVGEHLILDQLLIL